MTQDIQLPTINTPQPGRLRRLALHLARIILLIAILLLIHDQHRANLNAQQTNPLQNINIQQAQSFFPEAYSLKPDDNAKGGISVYSESKRFLGYVIMTSPQSDKILGYAGPSNMLIGLDKHHTIVGVNLLSSADTQTYVDEIVNSPTFWQQYNDMTWGEPFKLDNIQAISGATMTSQAITAAIVYRMGGNPRSLQFPKPLTLKEIQETIPQAASFEELPNYPGLFQIRDKNNKLLGKVSRTSPLGDDEVGYNGATDTRMHWSTDNILKSFIIRATYETPEYIDDIKADEYYHEIFQGKTLQQIADMDPRKIEGVSGATFTSQAMANAMIKQAKQHLNPIPNQTTLSLSIHDYLITAIIILALLAFSRRI